MIVAPLARWSSRIALFSACVLLVDVVLHRLTSFPTPVAVNLFAVGVAGGGLAVLVGLIAMIQIWRKGYGGAGSAAFGVLLPFIALAWPLTYVPAYLNLPPINDVTTDFASPPQFLALAKQRKGESATAAYPGGRFAAAQQKAYPELRTFVVDRPAEEAFELVEEAVRKLKWRVAASEPPVTGRGAKPGILEATDTDAGRRLHRRHRRPRRGQRQPLAHRRALRLALRRPRSRRRTPRACAASSPSCRPRIESTSPGVAGRRGLRTTRAGAHGQESERTRSGESGGSQRTSPRSIKCSTCARTERDAALRSLGSRPL